MAPCTHQSLPAAGTPPGDDLLHALCRRSLELEDASPEEIIAWAVETYFPRLTMATALGPEGCLILSILAKIEPQVYVFNLDTGYQFEQTFETRERVATKYGIRVDYQRPELTVGQFEALHSGPLYGRDPARCCHERKIKVMRRVVRHFDAWISGIRRNQSPHRSDAPIVSWDRKFGLVKINPLANWTRADVWKRIARDEVPYNPLHDQGYPSVGCWPCTLPVREGEGERAGRWNGSEKTECGLHTVNT